MHAILNVTLQTTV